MRGLNINGVHTGNDYDLVLHSLEIEEPDYKDEKVDVPGGNGDLDMTEWAGQVFYENRKLKAEFEGSRTRAQWEDFADTVRNNWHGRHAKIITDDNPTVYFSGRMSVKTSWIPERGGGVLQLIADCEPYRYKLQKTAVNFTVGTATQNNICPSFALWNVASESGTVIDPDNIDIHVHEAVIFYVPVSPNTSYTIKAAKCGRLGIAEYKSNYTWISNTLTLNAGTNRSGTLTTGSNTAFLKVSLNPRDSETLPARYSEVQIYQGTDSREYVRYNNGNIIWLNNAAMPSTPTVTVSAATRLTFSGSSISLTAGTHVLHEFTLPKGDSYIQIAEGTSGSTVKVEYQEGKL